MLRSALIFVLVFAMTIALPQYGGERGAGVGIPGGPLGHSGSGYRIELIEQGSVNGGRRPIALPATSYGSGGIESGHTSSLTGYHPVALPATNYGHGHEFESGNPILASSYSGRGGHGRHRNGNVAHLGVESGYGIRA